MELIYRCHPLTTLQLFS